MLWFLRKEAPGGSVASNIETGRAFRSCGPPLFSTSGSSKAARWGRGKGQERGTLISIRARWKSLELLWSFIKYNNKFVYKKLK